MESMFQADVTADFSPSDHQTIDAECPGVEMKYSLDRSIEPLTTGRQRGSDPTPAPPATILGQGEMSRTRVEHVDIREFLDLDRSARIQLIANIAKRPPIRHYTGSADRLDRAFRMILSATQIVGHARNNQRVALVEAIASGLDLDADIVIACLDDGSGEAAAVLLKALGLDNTQAQQVFLFSTPTLGLDVNGFLRLTEIYSSMESWVAEILTDDWRKAIDLSYLPGTTISHCKPSQVTSPRNRAQNS